MQAMLPQARCVSLSQSREVGNQHCVSHTFSLLLVEVTHWELMVPALATAASSEASSMEGLEPRELRKEFTRDWQGALLPARPKASCTQSAHTCHAQLQRERFLGCLER